MSRNKPGFRGGREQGAITENVELLTGQRGSGLDRAITLRDLADLGLARLRRFGQGAAGGVMPELNPDLIPGGDAQRPGKPQNLMASGAFHNIILAWDEPTYRGHSHTEIWRAPADNLAAAELVGTTNANLYADAVGGALKAWYWVRFVNVNDIEGPYSGPGGKYAETSRAIDDILEEMAGKISESELTAALRETIGDLDALWTAKAGVGEIVAGIGLLARPDGTTEAAVSAGRFSVFDPAKPTTKDNLFVVEGGKVYMNIAFIKQAYIEQVAAAQVTADRVNAVVANITTAKIADAAITSAKIKDAAITSAKIANAAIGNANIKDASISSAKIANAAITNALISDAAITAAKIGTAEIDTLRIRGNAVTIPLSVYVSASGTGSLCYGVMPEGNQILYITFDCRFDSTQTGGDNAQEIEPIIRLYVDNVQRAVRSGSNASHIEFSTFVGPGAHTIQVVGDKVGTGTVSFYENSLFVLLTKR